jgi:hypothetical protein
MIRTSHKPSAKPAGKGHNSTSGDLKDIFAAARPLIEQWLDVGEQIAALREVATAKGLDWSQLKALLKAQIQDERDDTGEGKRVRRIVEKAEFASAYADMLGLANMNEKKYSAEPAHEPDAKLVETIVKGVQTDIGRKALVSALDVLIEAEEFAPERASERPVDGLPATAQMGPQAVTAGETATIHDVTDPGDIPDFLRRAPQ